MGTVSSIPQRIEVQPDNIPAELKSLDKWLVWMWVIDPKRPGKPAKPPYSVHTDKLAEHTNPKSWGTFEQALDKVKTAGKYHGVGFELSAGEGLVAWDLDHCIDPKSGKLEAWAKEIVDALNSYTEITPSGEGLRIFVKGDIPEDGRKKGPIECYKHLRYVTVTGYHYPNTPLVINESDDVMWKKIFAPDKPEVRRLKQSKQTALLLEGKWSEAGYPSQSEADLAFCRYLAEETDGDAAKIDELFRKSKLFREKWDKRHHGDGTTYGEGTIRQALAGYDSRFRLTDLGNARRFARILKDKARFCQGRWYIWDEKRLGEDKKQAIYLLSYEVIKELAEEAKKQEDDDRRKKFFAHALQLESRGKLDNMIKLTEHQEGIAILAEELDKNPYLFNCNNGVLNEKRELYDHKFDDLLTKLSPVNYNPNAKSPTWEKFLQDVLPDQEVIDYLSRAVGYSMTGLITEQKLFFAYGTGKNGKSTFFHAINLVFGDYFSSMPVESLMAKSNDQHPTVLADLRGVRFVLASEPEEGRRFNEGLLKQITGGEKIVARRMREDFFRFDSSAKLWIMGNHKPTIRGTDYAIWRRIHLIPFTVTIPKEKQDKNLWMKLEAEKEGILAWCVRGYEQWLKLGLSAPKAVEVATEDYRVEMDTIQDFINDECVLKGGVWTLHSDLYARYAGTARDKNERILSSKVFSQKLREKGFESARKTGNQLYWENILLIDHQHSRPEEM